MDSIFIQAEWRKLLMVNYAIDPTILTPWLPSGTELDIWNNTCFVSLVGFMFKNTRAWGLSFPFHKNFEEVNLRFYVRHLQDGHWKRGVVFIKEIVPKPLITFIARTLYGENYVTRKMSHQWKESPHEISIEYQWKTKQWNKMRVVAESVAQPMQPESEAEFITEHYWGYTKKSEHQTGEYAVEHPRWEIYPVRKFEMEVDFLETYGSSFEFLKDLHPSSVFLAEGSGIVVKKAKNIRR